MEKIDALRIMQLNENELSENVIEKAYEKLYGSMGESVLNEAKSVLSFSLLENLKEKENTLKTNKEKLIRRNEQIAHQLSKYMEVIKKLQKEQEKINNNLPNYDSAISKTERRIEELEIKNKELVEENKRKEAINHKENIINNKKGLQKNADEIFKQLDTSNPNYNDLRKQYDSIVNLIADYDRELKEIEEQEKNNVLELSGRKIPALEDKSMIQDNTISNIETKSEVVEEPKKEDEDIVELSAQEYPAIEDKSMEQNGDNNVFTFDNIQNDINVDTNQESVSEINDKEDVQENDEVVEENNNIFDINSIEADINNAINEENNITEEKEDERVYTVNDGDFDINSIESNLAKENEDILESIQNINIGKIEENLPTFDEPAEVENEQQNIIGGYVEKKGPFEWMFPVENQSIVEEEPEVKQELTSTGISTTKSAAENLVNQEFSDEKTEIIKQPVGLLNKLKYKLNKKNIERARVELTKEFRKINYDNLRVKKLKELIDMAGNNEAQKNEYEKLINKLYVGKDIDVKYINENLSKLENIDPDIKESMLNEIINELPTDIDDYNVNDEIVDTLYVGSTSSDNYTEEDVNAFYSIVDEIDNIKNGLSNGESKLGR